MPKLTVRWVLVLLSVLFECLTQTVAELFFLNSSEVNCKVFNYG